LIDFPANITDSIVNSKGSNFPVTIDMDDITKYDLATLTLYLTGQYEKEIVGKIILTNNTGKTIAKIDFRNANFPFIIYPATGSVSFQNVAVATSTINSLLCDAAPVTNLITGRTSGSDFIEYAKSGDKFVRTNMALLS